MDTAIRATKTGVTYLPHAIPQAQFSALARGANQALPPKPREGKNIMTTLSIGIAGAGLLGRLLAWQLARAGHRVSVFDVAESPRLTQIGRASCRERV